MKPGIRQHGPSQLRLRYSEAVPAHIRAGVLEITGLQTEEAERGKGHGTELLRLVCAEADARGRVLMLMPDESNLKQLAEWYGRFGFKPIQAKPVLMARQPGTVGMKLKPLAHAMGMH